MSSTNTTTTVVSTNDLNVEFLPLIYDIIRSIEKESQDSPSQRILLMREQQPSDCNAKMQQLRERFAEFRTTIGKVPGIGVSKEEQLQTMRSLRQQLVMKKELLMKYKNNSIFEQNQNNQNNQNGQTNNNTSATSKN